MLSSRGDSKQDARFVARLDVLMERVDTLASTVATTASAIAKKDGEIAALRRDLETRDHTVQALVERARAAEAIPSGPAAEATELRSLRNAVAALTKEHAQGGSAARVAELAASVHSLAQRVETLAATTSATASHEEPDEALRQRLSAIEIGLASVRAQVEDRARDSGSPSEELLGMLERLRSQVEALGGIASGVSEEQLDRRLASTDDELASLGRRIDLLATHVESATSSLSDKEHELAALHRHFNESSTRIESIVDDIREALTAFPELGSASLADIAARLEHLEQAQREAAEAQDRVAAELARRVDSLEQRVASVATEVARAKTLWPVALRSLEARLDDAVHARRPGEGTSEAPAVREPSSSEPAGDLLAGLRDSLQAMENVAAEMARASDALDGPEPDVETSDEPRVAAAGATIVPLRTGDP